MVNTTRTDFDLQADFTGWSVLVVLRSQNLSILLENLCVSRILVELISTVEYLCTFAMTLVNFSRANFDPPQLDETSGCALQTNTCFPGFSMISPTVNHLVHLVIHLPSTLYTPDFYFIPGCILTSKFYRCLTVVFSPPTHGGVPTCDAQNVSGLTVSPTFSPPTLLYPV